MLHINCRSLLPKLDEIEWLLSTANIDVACISETWLSKNVSDTEVNIDGYNITRKDRIGRSGGGVLIYSKQNLDIKERCDLVIGDNSEMIWIELIMKKKENNILISCAYRPPNADAEYLSDLTDSIEKASSENKDMILMGDLNINYKIDENLYNNHIFLLEQLFSMKQLINEPTRVTTNTSTLIDIILTTCPSNHITSGVYKGTLSDHFIIFTELNVEPNVKKHHEVRFRNYRKFVLEQFLHDCCTLHDDFMMKYNNFNETNVPRVQQQLDIMWEFWKERFLKLSDKHAPFTISRLKPRHYKWITP
jgi:exonuclease III